MPQPSQSNAAVLAAGRLVQRRGLHAYVAGMPGFYVVNPRTNIAVAVYPYRQGAEAHAQMLDEQYPFDPLKMEIVEILP